MIEIEIDAKPYHALSYLNAGPKRTGYYYDTLPFLRGRVRGLPSGWAALVATGDLQGRSDFGDADETLLGVTVADELPEVQEIAGLPDPTECLGFMAGDFYTVPNASKRGGTGDVRLVWQIMAETFGELCGVAGNHDTFGEGKGASSRPPQACLDGRVVTLGALRIGGVSGIDGGGGFGLQRKEPGHYANLLDSVLRERPDILVLHAAPFVDKRHVGSQMIADLLRDSGFAGLVICGHCSWPERIQQIGQATVLNVHEAVVTLGE